jgi:dihydropyrimidinase
MNRLRESYKQKIIEHLKASENNHFIDYSIHASILNPIQIEDIPYLHSLGITSFKLYMNLGSTENRILMDMSPYENKLLPAYINVTDDLCKRVLKESSSYVNNSTVLVHAEDHSICSELINKNKITNLPNNYNPLEIWSKSRPTESEVIAIKKIMRFARQFQSNVYFVHIGSNDALDAILKEKQIGGCNVYIETCPHYLTHSVNYKDIKGKVVPPLRTKNDIAALWVALRNGVVDTIGTDHVANVLDLKYGENKDIWTSLAGFPGVATMLPVLLHYGVNSGQISIEKLVELTSYNASKIFGMYPKKGTIQKDSDADLVIIDLDLIKKVDSKELQSFSNYSIYDDYVLQGWPSITISRGEIIMEDGVVYNSKLGHGKFIKRNQINQI